MERSVCAISGNSELLWVENGLLSGALPREEKRASVARHGYRLSKLLVSYSAFDAPIYGDASPSVSLSELNAKYENDAGDSYWTQIKTKPDTGQESARVIGEYEVRVPQSVTRATVVYGKQKVRGIVGLSFGEDADPHVSGAEVGEVVTHIFERDLVGFAFQNKKSNLKGRRIEIQLRAEENIPLIGEQNALEAWERENAGWEIERTWPSLRKYQRFGHWLRFVAVPRADYWATDSRELLFLVGECDPEAPLSENTVADWRKAVAYAGPGILDRYIVPTLKNSLKRRDSAAAKLVAGGESV